MSNILIINGAKQFEHSNGELNDTLTQFSESHLTTLGHTVQVTRTDSEYDIQAEIKKYLWADLVIYQMPGWWKSGVISMVLNMYLPNQAIHSKMHMLSDLIVKYVMNV